MTVPFYKWLTFGIIWLAAFTAKGQKGDSIPEHEQLYKIGVQRFDSGQYKQAIPFFKKAIHKKKDYWEAYLKKAQCEMALNDFKSAEKDLDQAEKIASFLYEIYKLKGINFFKAGKYPESKASLDTAIYIADEEKLEDPEVYYYRGQLMFKGKSYKTALAACDVATELDARYAAAYVLKGEIRFAMKEYNYAIRELTQAIDLMTPLKTDYNAYRVRAKSRFEVADYKGAVRDWDVFIDANPRSEEALIARGAAKINLNDNTGAIADLDAAIAINPKNAVSWCYRGVAKGGNKAYIEALKDLDQSIKLKFDYPAAYVNRAAIRMASKDRRGACDDLAKADGLGDEMALRLIEKYCKH